MPRVANSKLRNAGKERQKKDDAKKEAVRLYKLEQEKPPKERRSARDIAADFNLSHTTVTRLAKPGAQTVSDFNDSKNAMGNPARHILVDWLTQMADRALPVTRKLLKEKATQIIRATGDPDHAPVSDSWVDRFLASPMCADLSTHWSSDLTKDRARAVNPISVKHWFDAVEARVVNAGIPADHQFAMDETGFMEGQSHKVRVIGRRGAHNTYKRGGGSRKSVTVFMTICADGTALVPTVIFKGLKLLKRWGQVNPLKANICRARKGYTNNELGVSYIRNFDEQTRDKADMTRVLFLDVHKSHYSLAFLDFAIEHDILIMGYYPHSTAVMQGLDVVCFGALKINYGNEKDEFERRTGEDADGGNFLQIYAPAHRKTFTEQTIRAAFRKTGLVPFNRDVIDPKKLAPAQELSTQGSFPIRQPSPVTAILEAFKKGRGKAPTSPSSDQQMRTPLASRENTMDLTPRVNHMLDGLGTTSSSFLVSDANPFTSALKIPPPTFPRLPEQPSTWETILQSPSAHRSQEELEMENRILRAAVRDHRDRNRQGEAIIEAQNSQLVLQNIYSEKQRRALHHQERKRKRSNAEALLSTEMGRIWTDPEFREAVRKDEEKASQKRDEAGLRAEKRKWRKAENKRIDEEHRAKRRRWEARREQMKKSGKRGGWGHPPGKPKRAQTPERFKRSNAHASAEDGDDSGDPEMGRIDSNDSDSAESSNESSAESENEPAESEEEM